MVDIEILKTLGTAITSIKAISDIAGTITNAHTFPSRKTA